MLDSLVKKEYAIRMSVLPWALMAGGSLLADYTNPIPQPGQEGYTATPQHHLRVVYDNDVYFGHDGNYTHATRFDYAQLMEGGDAWGVSLVQDIYTPEHHTKGAVMGEHPYCGYLAVGGAYLLRGVDCGAAFEFQVGTTGNASGSRYTQNGFHEATGIETWDGWDDQVPAEMTFQLSMRQDFRIPWLEFVDSDGWQTDATLYTREEVGTAFIRGGVGMNVRYGVNLPPAMQVPDKSAGSYGVSLLEKPEYRRDETSYFILAGVYAEYVARDISIDGGVFHYFEPTCSREPWVFKAQLGLGATYKGIDYFFGALYQTDSYRSQEMETFLGTFSITWHW